MAQRFVTALARAAPGLGRADVFWRYDFALGAVMQGPEIEVVCDLHAGDGSARMLFTDLSHAYIDENRTTS